MEGGRTDDSVWEQRTDASVDGPIVFNILPTTGQNLAPKRISGLAPQVIF